MPIHADPPGAGGPNTPKPSKPVTSPRGRTSNARTAEPVDVEPYHTDLLPSEEYPPLSRREVNEHCATPLLTDEEEEDDDEVFEDALDYVYQEPPATESLETVQAVESKEATPRAKGSLVERFFAALMVWAMDLAKVKSKLSLDAGAVVSNTKAKIADMRQQVKSAGKSGNRVSRQQSKQELAALKQDRAQAKAARNSEYMGYVKFLRALKQIYQKKIDRHNVHLSGMTLGDGRAALKDVDLSVSQVDLVEGHDGHSVPEITADINGILEIPFQDRPPLRVRLEMKDVKVAAEGRLLPIARALIISRRSIPNILRQLVGLKKSKGKLFALSRFGIEAGSIRATVENPDSETLAAIITRGRSNRGRAIDKIFTSLGLPLEFKTDELELMVATEADGATPDPLLTARKLHVHYHPPASAMHSATDPREIRELGISADSLDVNTRGLSDAVSGTIQQLTPELMELTPEQELPQNQWLEQLAGQSTGLKTHVEQLDLSLGREVTRKDDKVKLTGGDQLQLSTGPLEIHNEGRAKLAIKAGQLRLSGSKEGENRTYALDAMDYNLKADLKQALPKNRGRVDIHGEVSGDQLLVAGFSNKEDADARVLLKKTNVKTGQQASTLQAGKIRLQLPDDLKGSIDKFQLRHHREHGRKEADILLEGTELKGTGQLRLETDRHRLSLPVQGHVSNSKTNILWDSQEENAFGQTHSGLKVKPGKLTLENVKIDQAHVGEAGFDIDDQMSGKVVLKDIEVDLAQLLGENSPLSYQVQKRIPEVAVKGRKIKLSLEFPVDKGELVFPKAKVLACTMSHEDADTRSWTGWGVKQALKLAGYLKKLVGAFGSMGVEDIRVSDGRLWVQPRISLSGMGSTKPWLPLFAIPGYDVKGDTGVMLPELLHSLTGAHFCDLNPKENDLIHRVNSGSPDIAEELAEYCRTAGQDKASHILKTIDISPWLKLAESGNDRARILLASLAPVFRQFPVVAGKALSINLLKGWPVTPEDVDYFCADTIKKHLHPAALAGLLSKAGDYDKARQTLVEGLKKTPANAELLWHEYTLINHQIHASARKPEAAKTIENLRREQITKLRQAARLGHPMAMAELKSVAERGNPEAQLGYAGITLTRNKTANAFYSAIQCLEQASQHTSSDYAATALEILTRRARNSRKIFIHALPEQDELLAKQNRLIASGKELQLTPQELYLWGVRYLYGIEGIKPDRAEAIKLLQLAKSKGFDHAQPHIDVINRMQGAVQA